MSRTPVLLLVDDDAHILSALVRTLRREGWELRTAASAAEALETLAAGAVDAIVSDHKMPGRSGLELLREVADRWPAIPRILLTGWPEAVPEDERSAQGIDAVLPKPWEDADLRTTLRRLIGG